MMMKIILGFIALLGLVGCANVADHRKALENSSEQKLTLGTAQRTITQGMAQGDVVAACLLYTSDAADDRRRV
jgi:hypothetical protein